MPEVVEVLVDGGKATPGPPLGPVLGPMQVNIVEIVKVINEKTKAFAGMKVPVKITIDPKTKAFDVSVGTPPTSALIIKELKIPKGSGANTTTKVGNLTIEQMIKIANMKESAILGKTLKNRCLEVAGTCVSMGITINGEDPKQAQFIMKSGKWDAQFKE
ncbi:MAG: 50S ribosomal protein L11 [Candidatus Thermoplasmatota archaeon]|nr:50S ribosomal protein L11 [Euryarchaeota archaeon]MBU4031403.1 50S ribosomal protein L11 [Candidatus Thermoplasmatota archaeon]MBU4072239.1 50S ribosomal protein L11 [Candidatus Thermoplasmatota archaeon]MBU4145270.1 50S ribosomal protein L11 [Candidatus Thermoplasmatota archaeon]MBU4591248.1 50S ribosomal protein L11 [Candidatus Thermoplasmatota archaeon]